MKKRMKRLLLTSVIFLIISILMILIKNLSLDNLIINLSFIGYVLLIISVIGIIVSFVK